MKFENRTNDHRFYNAISEAESLLSINSPLMELVEDKNDWKYNTNMFGVQVAFTLSQDSIKPLSVNLYTPDRKTSAIGYYDGAVSMFFNKKVLDSLREDDFMEVVVPNLIHEWAHYKGFNHGTGIFRNYKTKRKCNYSVPYYISENAKKFL